MNSLGPARSCAAEKGTFRETFESAGSSVPNCNSGCVPWEDKTGGSSAEALKETVILDSLRGMRSNGDDGADEPSVVLDEGVIFEETIEFA